MTTAITELNLLPIRIDTIGEYITRGGDRVIVHDIKDHSDDYTVTRFNVDASRIQVREGKRDRSHWGIWHESGRQSVWGEDKDDIVGKYIAR